MEHNDTSDLRAKIMEHYANPQFKGFKNQGEKYEAQSPTCSDRIQLEIASENDIVTHIAFEGEGCAVSLASSDTFCQTIQGKSKAAIQEIIAEYKKMLLGEPFDANVLGELVIFKNVGAQKSRITCASTLIYILGIFLQK